MSLVTKQELFDYIDELESSQEPLVLNIRSWVEKWIKNYCKRDFELTDYNEWYNGTGSKYLFLKQYPLVTLDRVSVAKVDVITVENDEALNQASISVTETGLRLVKDSLADTSITFSDSTNLSAIVTAINAKGDGWSASLVNSDYGTIPSSELCPVYGRSVQTKCYLQVPDEGISDFHLYPDEGYIVYPSKFPSGIKNVRVDYRAGYESIPEDLKLAVLVSIKHVFQRKIEETFGVQSFRTGELSATLISDLVPKEAKEVFNYYRKRMIL